MADRPRRGAAAAAPLRKAKEHVNVSSMSVAQLKMFLREHDESDKGRKAELLERAKTVVDIDGSKTSLAPEKLTASGTVPGAAAVAGSVAAAAAGEPGETDNEMWSGYPEWPTDWKPLDEMASKICLDVSSLALTDYWCWVAGVNGTPQMSRHAYKESDELYKKGYASECQVTMKDGFLFFQCKFRDRDDRDKHHCVQIAISRSGYKLGHDTVQRTRCDCPDTKHPEKCEHIGAVCEGLLDASRTGMFIECISGPGEEIRLKPPPEPRRISEVDFSVPEYYRPFVKEVKKLSGEIIYDEEDDEDDDEDYPIFDPSLLKRDPVEERKAQKKLLEDLRKAYAGQPKHMWPPIISMLESDTDE